jgi:hypothetical protein
VFVQDPSPEFGMTKKTSRLEVAFGKSEARASHHVYPITNHDHEHGNFRTRTRLYSLNWSKHEAENPVM